jgi:Iap family predicted aminopeptidase
MSADLVHEIERFVNESPTNEKRRQYLENILKEHAIAYTALPFEDGINLYAEGSYKNRNNHHVILVAHYDAVVCQNAYLDNTAGVVLLAALKTRQPDWSVLFTDKEEPPYCGKGAKNFIPYAKPEDIFINIDIIGTAPHFIFDILETYPREKLEELATLTHAQIAKTPFQDATIFDSAGLPAIHISSDNANNSWYHCHDGPGSSTLTFVDNDSLHKAMDLLEFIVPLV